MVANGAIGTTPLGSLDVTGDSFLNEGHVTSASDATHDGRQRYGGLVWLGANSFLTGVNLTFEKQVYSNGGPFALTATGSGTTWFQAPVGSDGHQLKSLLVNGSGAAAKTLLGKSGGVVPMTVTSTDFQTYLDPTTLNVNTVLTTTAGGIVTFGA